MGYPSGQREQTVNLPGFALRRFESYPHHGRRSARGRRRRRRLAGVAQLVERQPSKLNVAGSSPVARLSVERFARVAQSVERILGKDEVTGSIPVASCVSELPAIRYQLSAGAEAGARRRNKLVADS